MNAVKCGHSRHCLSHTTAGSGSILHLSRRGSRTDGKESRADCSKVSAVVSRAGEGGEDC